LPLKDYGPNKFEAEPEAARVIVAGTEGGDVYIIMHPNKGNEAIDNSINRRVSAAF
jgi:hypothetical protein